MSKTGKQKNDLRRFRPETALAFLMGAVFCLLFLSILWIMALPCFGVGLRTAVWFLREKLYYVTQARLLSTVFLLLAFAILGFTPFVLLLSLVGAVRVLKEKRPARRDEE